MNQELTRSAMPYDDNPNIAWAVLFVAELAQGGLTTVCIAPGSRSTPLALAFHANSQIRVFQHLDERSAAFFALGMALAEDKPVALLCTSGTAAANFHPAVIEAQMSQVPLLVLTADRPHELRHSGANQTIDQVKMFGDHVLWAVDLAVPQPDAPPAAIRNLQTLAARALSSSNGIVKGPVHLNFPFRKPLEPADADNWPGANDTNTGQRPYTTIERGVLQPTAEQLALLNEVIAGHSRGLIICGPRCPGDSFPSAVAQFAAVAGYPILADPLSGVRFGPQVNTTSILGGYETFLQGPQSCLPKADVILRFGSVPTSKWLNRYLSLTDPNYHIHVRESGLWADQDHLTNYFLQVNATRLCQQLTPTIARPLNENWAQQWADLEALSWRTMSEPVHDVLFDGNVAATLLDQLPPETRLFAGNSLAIRHVDQFGRPQEKSLPIFANRGASGIDGNISTGLGIAAASNDPTVILVGDITFYHDSNGLLALKQLDPAKKVIIVLINNNGGGIFHRLPIAQFEPPFEELFLTAHNLDFAPIAAMYGLNHQIAQGLLSFEKVLRKAFTANSATIIEVRTNSQEDDRVRREIGLRVRKAIDLVSAQMHKDD